MRFLRIILFLITSLACGRGEETPSAKYGFQIFPKQTFLPGASYHLTFLRAEPDGDHGRMGVFAFSHTLDKPIRVWGFGFQGDGSLRVRFERFSRLQGNQWTEVSVGYCGTGAQTYDLVPNRDYLLRVPLWPFATTGRRGVVLLLGTPGAVVSDEFDGEALRKGSDSSKRSK